MTTTLIDLLRHGEPQGGKRYRGRTDDPLSELGWAQMRRALGWESGLAGEWDVVVTSPLLRCAHFAEVLAEQLKLPLQRVDDLCEIGFGDWEGQSADELTAHDSGALLRYYADPWNNTPPNAEPLAAFQARVMAAWQTLLAQRPGERILLVSHSGVMRTILYHLLALPPESLFRLHIPYACLSRVRIDGTGESALSSLISHNGPLQP